MHRRLLVGATVSVLVAVAGLAAWRWPGAADSDTPTASVAGTGPIALDGYDIAAILGAGAERTAQQYYQIRVEAYAERDLAGITERIDYIAGLGTTAIVLSEVSGTGDWGSIDPTFGTEADLRALVEAARDRDVDVLMTLATEPERVAEIAAAADGWLGAGVAGFRVDSREDLPLETVGLEESVVDTASEIRAAADAAGREVRLLFSSRRRPDLVMAMGAGATAYDREFLRATSAIDADLTRTFADDGWLAGTRSGAVDAIARVSLRSQDDADEGMVEHLMSELGPAMLLGRQPAIGAGVEQGITWTDTSVQDEFDATHPLYRHVVELAAMRREHPASAAACGCSGMPGTRTATPAFSSSAGSTPPAARSASWCSTRGASTARSRSRPTRREAPSPTWSPDPRTRPIPRAR